MAVFQRPAAPKRFCKIVTLVARGHGMKPPGSAGVPPAQALAQAHQSPRPGSTGNGARILLRPGPCGSRRQGGRVPHRGETERQATEVHAGGTPALPGGPPPIAPAARGGRRRLAGPQPCRSDRAVTPVDPSLSFVSLGGSLSTLHTSNFTLQTSHSRAPPRRVGRGRGYAILPGGGEKGLVTLLVFKTCASRRCRDGWVRFPHASANPL